MYTYSYFTVAQQRYCAYHNYVYNESKALTQGASTGPGRVEPTCTRVERPISPRGKSGEGRRELRFSDTWHPRIVGKNADQEGRRQAAKPVLALTSAELKLPVQYFPAPERQLRCWKVLYCPKKRIRNPQLMFRLRRVNPEKSKGEDVH